MARRPQRRVDHRRAPRVLTVALTVALTAALTAALTVAGLLVAPQLTALTSWG